MLSTILSACSDLALKAINTPSYIFGDVRALNDIAYGKEPHQKLDLYFPQDDAQYNGALIVFVYGGGWTTGAKANYYFVAEALTAEGFAVAIPDYIKYPGGQFPKFVEDIALSISWLVKSEQSNQFSELILMGHSAGAHTGALLVTDPSYLAAVELEIDAIHAFVGLAGPYGFTPKKQNYRDIFGNLENYDVMRPQHFVSGIEPPMLLLHGGDDTTVLPVNSQNFAGKVNAKGGSAVDKIYPGMAHVSPVLSLSRVVDTNNELLTDVLQFLQDNTQTARLAE